ncbi:MAG: AAA family ATPase, partial [Chlorobi bacterium]|nr:AAA family ATPase [Chlorobiota bacterium]
VYLIDEIDRSMHPILTKGILDYFLNQLIFSKGQLIVTTHESNLLDLEMFRKDEIWFVEKNQFGSSSFYSLLEFKPRADKDIKKGYLNGRFGAIPFLSNSKDLNW